MFSWSQPGSIKPFPGFPVCVSLQLSLSFISSLFIHLSPSLPQSLSLPVHPSFSLFAVVDTTPAAVATLDRERRITARHAKKLIPKSLYPCENSVATCPAPHWVGFGRNASWRTLGFHDLIRSWPSTPGTHKKSLTVVISNTAVQVTAGMTEGIYRVKLPLRRSILTRIRTDLFG